MGNTRQAQSREAENEVKRRVTTTRGRGEDKQKGGGTEGDENRTKGGQGEQNKEGRG